MGVGGEPWLGEQKEILKVGSTCRDPNDNFVKKREVIIIGGGTEVHCDLNSSPAKDLAKLLTELK